MALRLVYRSYGGENRKGRPDFYSKEIALASFIRAAQAADAQIVFFNNGPLRPDLLDIMGRHGTIISATHGRPLDIRRSYLSALRVPDRCGWADDDIVYFCEDDYLHTQDAFVSLSRAAGELGHVDYFALYAETPSFPRVAGDGGGWAYPPGWHGAPPVRVGDQTWEHVVSTTSTFGGRLRALRADRDIFTQCTIPYRRRYLDHATCLLLQGHPPFPGRQVLTGAPGDYPGTPSGIARSAFLVPFRVGYNARARRQSRRPHLLYAPSPNLACHLETAVMNPGRDWAAQAREVDAWARVNGISIPSSERSVA